MRTRDVLTKQKFGAWLQTAREKRVEFVTNDRTRTCPISKYLSDQMGGSWISAPDWVQGPSPRTLVPPKWVSRFICQFDECTRGGFFIPARVAIEVLNEI